MNRVFLWRSCFLLSDISNHTNMMSTYMLFFIIFEANGKLWTLFLASWCIHLIVKNGAGASQIKSYLWCILQFYCVQTLKSSDVFCLLLLKFYKSFVSSTNCILLGTDKDWKFPHLNSGLQVYFQKNYLFLDSILGYKKFSGFS